MDTGRYFSRIKVAGALSSAEIRNGGATLHSYLHLQVLVFI